MDIQKHRCVIHRDQEAEWFEPVPMLEGDIEEITEETLRENIALIKKESTDIKDNDDDEEEELPEVPQI